MPNPRCAIKSLVKRREIGFCGAEHVRCAPISTLCIAALPKAAIFMCAGRSTDKTRTPGQVILAGGFL